MFSATATRSSGRGAPFRRPGNLIYIAGYLAKGIWMGIRVRRLRRIIRGLVEGLRAIPSLHRDPIEEYPSPGTGALRRKGALRLTRDRADCPRLALRPDVKIAMPHGACRSQCRCRAAVGRALRTPRAGVVRVPA